MKIYTKNDPCPFVKGEMILVCDLGQRYGEHEFYQFSPDLDYPFLVISEGSQGRFVISKKYAKKIQPALEVDAKVWVRDNNQTKWTKRHFSKWGESGKIKCWASGGTSFTETSILSWSEYTREDPNTHNCCK